MRKKRYDLAVAYRVYPLISKTPAYFSKDKYKLVDLCLNSFKSSIGNLKAKIWAILDNCPAEYENLFIKYFPKEDIEFVRVVSLGNQQTFKLQIEILLKQNDSNIVYFAEDDYFYLPNQFKKLIQFLISGENVDFVTPYDHLDYYTHPLHDYSSQVRVFSKKHWRTVSSTCLTFLTTKQMLKDTKNTFLKYSYVKNFFARKIFSESRLLNRVFSDFLWGVIDPDLWVSLTKINVFNIFKIIKLRFRDRFSFRVYFRAWRYIWKQLLFGKKLLLWCPIPSIATHMESTKLAPAINWERAFKSRLI